MKTLTIFSKIEDSNAVAVDTNIKDIIITGELNFNIMNKQSSRKMNSLCTQYRFLQSIDQPTHYTETSRSLINILLVYY